MLKASVRAVLTMALLSLGAISLQGCAYDPYAGTYAPYAAPAYGYYPYAGYDYYYAPPVYGSVVIGGGWVGGGYHGWDRRGWRR